MQVLYWNQVVFDSELSPARAGVTARFECVKCGELWTDAERRANIKAATEYRAHAPFEGKAGFWISHLYSNLPVYSLGELTREWLESKGDLERRKVFINTDLAELWEDEGEQPDHLKVRGNAESFAMGQDADIPPGVVFLMSGVDVQAKRLEVQVLGFGPDLDNVCHVWTVDYKVIQLFESDNTPMMTTAPGYWIALEAFLRGSYKHPCGSQLPILAMSIDVGYNPDPVYKFAKLFPQASYGPLGLTIMSPRTVLCTRGYDTENLNAIHRVTERETARTRKGAGHDLPIVTLGTGYLKTELYSELLGRADLKRIHIAQALSEDYFRGLVAEKKVVSTKNDITWQKIFPRNEPLDTWIYAKGAFYALKADQFKRPQWDVLRRKFKLPDPIEGTKPPEKPAARKTTITSSYLD
jgi:phage terminase large subunit GpA-like protein